MGKAVSGSKIKVRELKAKKKSAIRDLKESLPGEKFKKFNKPQQQL